MRLIASSDRDAVPRAEAIGLLYERLALADAVACALDTSEGEYFNPVAGAALTLLHRWIGGRYYARPGKERGVWDGLDTMTVPAGASDLMDQVRRATSVAGALAVAYTADTRMETVHDFNEISAALNGWRSGRPADPTLWSRPVAGGPSLTLPYPGLELSDRLVFADRATAEEAAADWTRLLADSSRFQPGTAGVMVKLDVQGRPLWWLAW